MSRRDDKSDNFRIWTDRKLVRVAKKRHEELNEWDGSTVFVSTEITHDAIANLLSDMVGELKRRGYRVDGINDKRLVVTKEDKDEA